MLTDRIRLNFAVPTAEVRVSFTVPCPDRIEPGDILGNTTWRHNDICECPPTLDNLLVVRKLLDAAIADAQK